MSLLDIKEVFDKVNELAIVKSKLAPEQVLGTSIHLVEDLFIVYVEEIHQLSMGSKTEIQSIGVHYNELNGHHVTDN